MSSSTPSKKKRGLHGIKSPKLQSTLATIGRKKEKISPRPTSVAAQATQARQQEREDASHEREGQQSRPRLASRARPTDEDAIRSGTVTLHELARRGHAESLALYLELHKPPKEQLDELDKPREGKRRAPIHYAARNGHADMVDMLISAGARVNIASLVKPDMSGACGAMWMQDDTALHIAARYNHETVARVLLRNGAKMGIQNAQRETQRRVAQSNKSYAILLLLEATHARDKRAKKVDFSGLHLRSGSPECRFLGMCKYVQKLSLAGNLLRAIPVEALESLAELTQLDVSNNFISEISTAVSRLTRLEVLDISTNRIDVPPVALTTIPKLRKLKFKGNPFQFVPNSVQKNDREFLKYLTQLKESTIQWKKLKLLIVGEENVGKSTLLRCLQSFPNLEGVASENISTNGVAIDELTLGDTVEFSAWDFGGQEVFYPTHQFFLTGRSVYLVVFSLVQPESFKRVEYWLQQIELVSSMSKSYVLVVATHADDPQCTPAFVRQRIQDFAKFQKRFRSIRSCAAVSCSSGEGISNLRLALQQVAHEHYLLNKLVPGKWETLDSKIKFIRRKPAHRVISWEDCISLGESIGISESDLMSAMSFLKDVGTVVFFMNSGAAHPEFIITDPSWLADVMSSVITFRHNWIKDGIFFESDYPHVWEEHPPELYETFAGLLQRFEIAHRMRGDPPRWLLPSLLPETKPAALVEKWALYPTADQLQCGRRYDFSFLPAGLFGRVLVRVLHIPRIEPVLLWRNGALMSLSDTQQLALVQYDSAAFRLDITVRTPHGEIPVLRDIIAEVDQPIEAMYDFRPEQKKITIPCIHCVMRNPYEDPYYFTYEECVEALTLGAPFVYCHGIKSFSRSVRVDMLAPDIGFDTVEVLEDLVVGKKLAKGGFGIVYKGTLAGETVAIKELTIKGDGEVTDKFKEFQHEVHIMSALEHPNLVRFYGITLNPLRMVMEFVSHGDLYHMLQDKSITDEELPWSFRMKIALDIAKGMRHLQAVTPPIIHRDLRSPNVLMVSRDPNAPVVAKVADFGLAQSVAPLVSGALGTWQWLAPEIVDNENLYYDERADVYSFGIVFWEIITRGIPFDEYATNPLYAKCVALDEQGEEVWLIRAQEVKRAIVHNGLRPTIPVSTPADIRELLLGCWKGNRDARISFDEVVRRLCSHLKLDYDECTTLTTSGKVRMRTPAMTPGTPIRDGDDGRAPSSPAVALPEAEESTVDSITCTARKRDLQVELTERPSAMHACLGRVWVGCKQGSLFVFDIEMEVLLTRHRMHDKRIYSIVSVDKQVWTSSEYGKVFVWDAEELCLIAEIHAHPDNSLIRSLMIDRNRVWSSSPMDCRINAWDVHTFHKVFSLDSGTESPANCMMLMPNQELWVGTHKDLVIYDFDASAKTLTPRFRLLSHSRKVNCLLVVKGEEMWSGSDDGTICIWSIATKELIRVLTTRSGAIRNLVQVDGNTVWSGQAQNSIIIWDIRSRSPKEELTLSDSSMAMCSPKPSVLWYATEANTVHVLDYS